MVPQIDATNGFGSDVEPVPMPMPKLEDDIQPVPMPMPEIEGDAAPVTVGISEQAALDDCDSLQCYLRNLRPYHPLAGDEFAEVNIYIDSTVNIYINNADPVYLVPPGFDETPDLVPDLVQA